MTPGAVARCSGPERVDPRLEAHAFGVELGQAYLGAGELGGGIGALRHRRGAILTARADRRISGRPRDAAPYEDLNLWPSDS